MARFRLLSLEEIQVLLRRLPHETRLDLIQFALDLMGIVNPAADAANAALSLWRGDLFGAAVSAVSIIPIGDVLKVTKLGKYARTFETLVSRVVPNNPVLYRELAPAMEQFRRLIAKVPGGNESVEAIRASIEKFFRNTELQRLTSGFATLAARAKLAARRGRWADPAFAKAGTTPADVVERLLHAAEHGNHPSLTANARRMLEEMSERDWKITAGPHRTTATAGGVMDRTPHITLELDGMPSAYHVRLDAKGHVWEIRTMERGPAGPRAANPVPGTPRPWRGPGQ